MSPFNSIVGLNFKGAFDVINYHSNVQGPLKRPLNLSFCKLCEKLIRWPTVFVSLFGKVPKFLNFSDSMEKKLSGRIKNI